jgi:hypothetical protein
VKSSQSNGRLNIGVRCSPLTNTDSELSNRKDSPLLLLPGEIRNEIYSYLIAGHNINIYTGSMSQRSVRVDLPHEFRALPRVSRQIRKEVISYVAQHNNFSMRWQHMKAMKTTKCCSNRTLYLDLFPHSRRDNCPLSVCCVDTSFRHYCGYRSVERVFLRYWDIYGNVNLSDCEAVKEELRDWLPCVGRPDTRKPSVEYELKRLYRDL